MNDFQTTCGTFYYELNTDSKLFICGYEGNNQFITVPDCIDDMPVSEIAGKAFFSKKNIEKITLSKSIEKIGDWAFANMNSLKRIDLPASDITFGKQVFKDCVALSEIGILASDTDHDKNNENSDPFLPYYTASLVQTLKDTLLFTPSTIGCKSWYENFDKALLRLLERPDDDGFEPVFYGWFEDEDMLVSQLPNYIKKRRYEKASLILKRIVSPVYLTDNTKSLFEDYICKHMLTGVWDFVTTEENVMDQSYIKVLLNLGCITEDNFDSCLLDLTDKSASESVALLLQYKDIHFAKNDFFDGLKL